MERLPMHTVLKEDLIFFNHYVSHSSAKNLAI